MNNLVLQVSEIEKQVSALISENAELKEKNRVLDCMLTGESLISNERKHQLDKAKKLLTRFVMASVYFNGKETDLVEDAEQFLKEIE